ncbi:MAG: energy transducer TonB [Deltaproteobacteria bacterium]|nr:energy transducer TonB [Deltaproteobacteria bacterium]
MKDRTLLSSLSASCAIHLLTIPLASALMPRSGSSSSSTVIAVDLIEIPRVQEKKEEIVRARPAPKPETVAPPKLVQKPAPLDLEPPLPPAATPDEPKVEEQRAISLPVPEPEKVAPAKPISVQTPPGVPGPLKGSVIGSNAYGEAEGGKAGAGNLFSGGDVAVLRGKGVEAGGGGTGRNGLGGGENGRGFSGGGSGDGFGRANGEGSGEGLALARPLGGYQVKPRYPDAARRAGAQGVTVLKVRILENGKVGDAFVQQSAGHPDLDRSATEAVRKWRFEPARKGNEPIAVWVLLPVRFQLQ